MCSHLQSFWQPQDTPDSDQRAEKPSAEVLCPISGKKLRIKDLVSVKLTEADEGQDGMYVDPISLDILRNSSKLVVLKPTGDVVLEKTYRTCIRPDGVYKGAQSDLHDDVSGRHVVPPGFFVPGYAF